MNKNNLIINLSNLGRYPKWASLGWEARGMALELMNLGDRESLGTIPGEDEVWRSTLKIPSKIKMSENLKKTVTARGMRELNQIEILWNEVWKPELLRWFVLIDNLFVKEKPQYKKCVGRYWHPLLDDSNVEQNKNEITPEKKAVKAVRKTAKKSTRKKVKGKDIYPEWDFALIRYTDKNIRDCWDAPLSKESRQSLWDNAVSMLGNGNDRHHRQFIGKLIKDYGEKHVATAVAQLMVRPMPPADPKSFLRKTVQNLVDGSPAIKRARQQRVNVPL